MRLSAVGALAALGVAVTIAVAAVADYTDELIIAFLSVLVVACCGWLALTRRRGFAQKAGLVGFGLGVVSLVLQIGTDGLATIALVVGALALFGWAARHALGDEQRALRPVRLCTSPAVEGVLIINPRSGDGKAERLALADEAKKRGVQPLLLHPGDDLQCIAERAIAGGADVIGMAGGDGSQAVVASVAMRHGVAHVCIPSGTRNHFALDLGLDRDDVVGALDAFTHGIERRIDVATVNDRVFVNNASLGLYAHVVQSDCYRNAKLGTWRRTLPDLLGPEAERLDLRFEDSAGRDWSDAAIVLVSNNPYQVSRFGGAGTRPRLDTGRLGIVVVRVEGARSLARFVTLTALGQSGRYDGVREWTDAEFEVHSDDRVPIGLDGEKLVLEPPLRFASLPGALRVRLPRDVAGLSPAAVAVGVTWSNLGALVRIAVGR